MAHNNRSMSIYRTLWRWHFYAGLFCIPFVLTLSISGAIYLFKPQLDALANRPYQNLVVSGERSSADAQIGAALAAFPDSGFTSYQLPEADDQAVVITVLDQGRQRLVYVHPYSLKVLHSVVAEEQFIRQVRTFHGELLVGAVGSVLVELAGCWAIVLVLTGLYLWWPRNGRGLAGVLYPRLGRGGRLFWRDLHAVTGIWLAMFVLFLLMTALPWTLVWGTAFKELRQWGDRPVQQDWTLSRAQEHHHDGAMPSGRADLSEALLARAISLQFAAPVLLSPDRQNPALWKVQSQSQNRPLRADAWLDGQSGDVVRVQSFAARPWVDRVIGIGVAAHEGQLFGWLNQLLGALTALGLIFLTVSGVVLWWKRKPSFGLGAPAALPELPSKSIFFTIIVILALLLPMLAISLLLLWLLENLLLRHLPGARLWLGLVDPGVIQKSVNTG